MKVDEVIAAFLDGHPARSQNLRSYFTTIPSGERYGVLKTYDEVIAATNGGDLFIDAASKYTNTSTRHRNTLIAMAKVAGWDYTPVKRADLRRRLGLDPNERFTNAKKIPYRATGGRRAGTAAAPPAPMPAPRKVLKVDDPISYAIPPLQEGQQEIVVVADETPNVALTRLVDEAENNLAGADVLVAVPRDDGEADVTTLDDDGHRVVVRGGFAVGYKGTYEGKEKLLTAMERLGFVLSANSREAVAVSTAKVVVFLASGQVEEYR